MTTLAEQAERVEAIMSDLGHLWGLNRPLKAHELGRALRTADSDPGRSVRAWRKGTTPMPGPAAVALEMMEMGALPPDGLSKVLGRKVRA